MNIIFTKGTYLKKKNLWNFRHCPDIKKLKFENSSNFGGHDFDCAPLWSMSKVLDFFFKKSPISSFRLLIFLLHHYEPLWLKIHVFRRSITTARCCKKMTKQIISEKKNHLNKKFECKLFYVVLVVLSWCSDLFLK